MNGRTLFLVMLYCLIFVSIIFAQEQRHFSPPEGFDPNDPDKVLKASEEAWNKGDLLSAYVYYQRMRRMLMWDGSLGVRFQEMREPVAKAMAALTPEERTEYERFSAGVIAPEMLAQEPLMREKMRTFLKEGDEEAAGGYAEAIAKILPSDAEAAAALAARAGASLQNAQKAFDSGAVQSAAELLAHVPDAEPKKKALAARIQKALNAHEDLQGAMIAENAAQVDLAAKKLRTVYPKDLLLTVVEKWRARPAGMVVIPPGTFMMGCTSGDSACNLDEFPAHRVVVGAFYLDQTEVTVDAFGQCVSEGKCTAPKSHEEAAYCNWGRTDRGSHPVNCVEWGQAKAYCEWAGKRLPTEAEWEYAARGGRNDWNYPWGDEPADCRRAVISVMGDGCGKGRTWPAGSKGANDYGLFGMAGNVYEWVQDWINFNYFGAPADGSAWMKGLTGYRAARGGSWYTLAPESFRVSVRSGGPLDQTDQSRGFRCAKD